MRLPRLSLLVVPVVIIAFPGCGTSRTLQAVTVSPATATSSAQFTATGIYNGKPTNVDITATATTIWCVGSGDGVCIGNAIPGATVTAGMATCVAGFTGTVTVLAGRSGPPAMPDSGAQLLPFGSAQLNCP